MKQLKIMRGVPGVGKSTYIKKNFPDSYVCSADHYFTKIIDGKEVYTFDITKLSEAHGACFRAAVMGVEESEGLIVIDNTSIFGTEIAPYYLLGTAFGYEVEIITLKGDWGVCAERNLHGVPVEAVAAKQRMLGNERLPPYWTERVIEVE